jgi:hypothetical protein
MSRLPLLAESPRIELGACRLGNSLMVILTSVRSERNGLDGLNASLDGLWDGSISALPSVN